MLPKELQAASTNPVPTGDDKGFADLLQKSLNQTNTLQQNAEKAAVDIATGQVKDLHQAAIAIGKAETSMKLMLEVRNKAVSAYKEILRTQL
ncbi:MAG: flagellar hook-basal body complex protein FliE [Campylobacterales bacterium]|nr:flagellar hook-basal body complex protein FliE [Campylobacterales bacterium]